MDLLPDCCYSSDELLAIRHFLAGSLAPATDKRLSMTEWLS